jgi:hypothetical protein
MLCTSVLALSTSLSGLLSKCTNSIKEENSGGSISHSKKL